MDYQNYEEYMRSVLGYVPNTYYSENTPSYVTQQVQKRIEEHSEWYPEIYRIIYPMIQKACSDMQDDNITNETIENITNIIYENVEGDNNSTQNNQPVLRNGDVVNPRAKQQMQRETRGSMPNNPLLRDLIRILVLRELFDRRPQRPPFFGRPRQNFGPGMQPPRIY